MGAGVALITHAADPGPKSTDDLVTPDTQAAIDAGLAYLVTRLQGPDGSFSDARNANSGNTGITSLAALALMCGGHHPSRGKYGKAVAKAAEYVITSGRRNKTPNYLANADQLDSHTSMYQHGFSALFLAEVHGTFPEVDRRGRTRDMLEKSIALTVKAQNQRGGWRYTPTPGMDDVSVTVAQLMALRAAKNAGVYVDKAVVDKAVEYIKACQGRDGGFAYIKDQLGSLFPRSAAAVVGLYSAGIYDGEAIRSGLAYLNQFRPRANRLGPPDIRPEHYYYGHYYAALAMWTAGGNYWNDWFPAIRTELLLRREQASGVWDDRIFGTAYATAMACIILQLPNNYLPIMQK
jgi:hypothetical protein